MNGMLDKIQNYVTAEYEFVGGEDADLLPIYKNFVTGDAVFTFDPVWMKKMGLQATFPKNGAIFFAIVE